MKITIQATGATEREIEHDDPLFAFSFAHRALSEMQSQIENETAIPVVTSPGDETAPSAGMFDVVRK